MALPTSHSLTASADAGPGPGASTTRCWGSSAWNAGRPSQEWREASWQRAARPGELRGALCVQAVCGGARRRGLGSLVRTGTLAAVLFSRAQAVCVTEGRVPLGVPVRIWVCRGRGTCTGLGSAPWASAEGCAGCPTGWSAAAGRGPQGAQGVG